jgi:phage regulator Rha-like protein
MKSLQFEDVERKLLVIRNQQVLLDSDVAGLYGVETKRINEAVKNNPERFPDGYICQLSAPEKKELVENFDRFRSLKHSSARPKAFTERGLYMLATILKSEKAVETTLAIVETFSKIRELTRTVKALSLSPEKAQQKTLMQKSGKLIAEVLDDGLVTNNSETTIELNFAVLKFKHTIKKAADKK